MATCMGQSCQVAFASAASSGESNVVTAGAGVLLCYHFAGFVDHPGERFSVWSLR